MAFKAANLIKLQPSTLFTDPATIPAIQPQTVSPQMWLYNSGGDNVATVNANGYFNYFGNTRTVDVLLYNNGQLFNIGDLIWAVCADDYVWLQVTAITPSITTSIQIADPSSVNTAAIQDGAVTYPKIQNITTTDRVLGRATAGAGVIEEIACTAAGRAVIGASTAAAQRTAIGLGTLSIQDASNVAVTGGTLANVSATSFTHTTGSIGTAVTATTQAPLDGSTKIATCAYADAVGAAGAPVGATYITQTASGTLTNEQALGDLATGILKSTTVTGVVSIAAQGVDYYAPGGTDVALTDGGTNASLTASNGGIFYSTATAGAILSGTATANQLLLSGSNAAPAWSTATYPATTTINQLLYSSSANTITGLATANSGILVTSAGGVPSIGTAIPNGVTATTQSSSDNSTKVATTAYVDSASSASVGVGLTATYWKIHQELGGVFGNTTLGSTTAGLAVDTVYYFPAIVGMPTTITDLGINVSAAGTATTCLLCVYASNSSKTQPTSTPIANSTTSAITITGTGVKSATLGTPIVLQPGLYFFALLMNGTCTFVAASSNVIEPKFGSSTATGSKVKYYSQSSSYGGGFPTAGSLSESTNEPSFIYIRGNT